MERRDAQYSLPDALRQIDACSYECEAGPLARNVAYTWLQQAAETGPEYIPGQWVWFELVAKVAGKELKQWVRFCIVGCGLSADSNRNFWVYDLSYDPIGPWHNGTVHFRNVRGEQLRLTKPEQVPA